MAERSDCMNLAATGDVTISGELTVQLFAGSPNYESIAGGDAEEKALILELPRRLCAEDGGTFDRIHLSSHTPAVLNALNAAVGRRVRVRGEASKAETGHHHAPVVLFATKVTVN
jgi:Domain of unknown function (DUF4431)